MIGQNGPASRAISAKEAGYYSGFYFSFDTTARFLDKNKNDITDVSQLGQIAEIRRERKGYVGNFSFSSSVVFDNINVAQYQRGQIWIFSAHAIHIVTMINDTTSYSCSEEYNLNCTVSFVGRTVSLAKNGVTNLNLNGWSVNLQVTNNQAAGWIKKGDVPEGSVTISGGVCAITDYETGDTITITKDSISYNVKNGAPNEFEGSWRGAWTQDTADGTVHYLIAKNGEISGTVYHRAGNVEGKIWGFATPTGRFFGYYKYPDGKVYGVSGQLLKIDDYVRANFTSVINGTPTPGVATLKNQL